MNRAYLLAGLTTRCLVAWLIGMLLASPSLAGELAARVAWGQRVGMGILVPGIIQKVNVRPGQRVKAGEQLLALDQRVYRAQLVAAQARARRAKILREEAQREFDRAQELYDRTVLSEHDYTVAQIELRKAEAVSAGARSELAQARQQLQFSQIKAPFDGIVVERKASPGQAVTARLRVPELLVLADDRHLRVLAEADGNTLDALLAAKRRVVKLGGRDLAVQDVVPGVEAHASAQDKPLYPVTLFIERPLDLNVRAGQLARVVW